MNNVQPLLQVLIILSLFIILFYYLILFVRALAICKLAIKGSKLLSLCFIMIMLSKIFICSFYTVLFAVELYKSQDFKSQSFFDVNFYQTICCDGLQIIASLSLAGCYIQKYVSTRKRGDSRCLLLIFNALQILVFLSVVVVLILYNVTEEQNKLLLGLMLAGLNCLPIIAILLMRVKLSLRYSGTIIQDLPQNSKLNRLARCLWIILFCRLVQASINLLGISNKFQFIDFIAYALKQQHLQPIIGLFLCGIYLVTQFITGGLPIFVAQSRDMLKAIVSNDYQQSLLPQHLSDCSQQQIPAIQDFQQVRVIQSRHRGLDNKNLVFRKIKIELSPYILYPIQSDIKDQKVLQHHPIVIGPKNCIYKDGQLTIYYPYFQYSLQSMISNKLNLLQRKKLALKIAEAIDLLHNKNIYHGHLCPNNIFVNNNVIKIGDFGLLSLKKYLALFQDYTNKDVYTAPQMFQNKNKIIIIPTKEADIYSYGIILYQLLTLSVSYRKMTKEQIQRKMGMQSSRPKIPQDLDSRLASCIRQCWQSSPHRRPSASLLCKQLRQCVL